MIDTSKALSFIDCFGSDFTAFDSYMTTYSGDLPFPWSDVADNFRKEIYTILQVKYGRQYLRYETVDLARANFALRLSEYENDFTTAVALYKNVASNSSDNVNILLNDINTNVRISNTTSTDTGKNDHTGANTDQSKSAENPSATGVTPIDNYFDNFAKSDGTNTANDTHSNTRNDNLSDNYTGTNKSNVLSKIRDFYKMIGAPYRNFAEYFADMFVQFDSGEVYYYPEVFKNE